MKGRTCQHEAILQNRLYVLGDKAFLSLPVCFWLALSRASREDVPQKCPCLKAGTSCDVLAREPRVQGPSRTPTFVFLPQAKEAETCNVTIEGLDIDKCYFVRVRVKAMESGYGPDTYPSEWSEVAYLQRAELRGNVCHTAVGGCSPARGRRREWLQTHLASTLLQTAFLPGLIVVGFCFSFY